MTRSSPRKRPLVSHKEEDDKPVAKPSVAGKALGSLKSAAAKLAAKPAPKRKAESDDAAELQPKVAASQPKKRKTEKAKDEDTMPLADRTAVSSLKKAMFIGAHVSAAGGMLPMSASRCASTKTKRELSLPSRCQQFRYQCYTHRRQRVCAFPQVTAQMGQSANHV